MANTLLHPEAPEQGGVYDPEKPGAYDPAHLKDLETTGSSPSQTTGTGGNYGFYPQSSSPKSASSDQLKTAETSGGTSANSQVTGQQNTNLGTGFYNVGSSKTSSNSGFGANLRKRYNGQSKLRRGALIGAGVGGGGGLVILLILLFLFLSTLLIPGLAQNILTYEFARVERQLAQDTTEEVAESAEVQATAADTASSEALATEFSSDSLYQSLKNLNPQNFLNNLEEQNLLQYNYETIGGLRYPTSVRIGTATIDIPDQSFSSKYLHPITNFQDNVQFADNISSALTTVYPDSGIGVIIRGRAEQALMDSIDAPRFAWVASKFNGETPQQADLTEQDEAEQAIDPDYEVDGSLVYPETQAIQNAQADLEAGTDSANALSTYNNNGIPTAAQSDINGAAGAEAGGSVEGILSNLNLAYAILLPACIVYDGSISSPDAAQTIKTNSDEDQRSFFYLTSASSQQEYGDTNGEAVGAVNAKVSNDVNNSVPQERSNGQTVNTSGTVSPQTAGNGQFTAFNAFAPAPFVPILNTFFNNSCPVITNPYIAGAGALAQIAGLFTGDTEAEAPILADQGLIKGAVLKVVDSMTGALGVSDAGATKATTVTSKLIDLLPGKSDVVQIAGIVGLDWVVRIDTAMKAGELNDGLSQGTDFVDQADAGGNLNANDDMQQQFYGAPLSSSQVAYNNIQDSQFIADSYKKESIYDRYVSPTNPESLVAKVGLDLYGDLNSSFLPNLISSISRVFNPSTLVSGLYNLVNPSSKVMADTVADNDTADYGIVQWGYTDQEESLINTNSSYEPLQNDEILSKYPDQVQQIAATYGPCFTQDMSVLLTSDPSQGSLPPGTSSEPYIVRDANGNVTGGLCSSQYLGPDSTDPNAADNSNGTSDLIFRWRLQQAYNNTADTLTGLANANNTQ